MRLRAVITTLVVLSVSALVSVPTTGALARGTSAGSGRDAPAPTPRSFYVFGTFLTAKGAPTLLAGLATTEVASTGAFSGTLTMAGPKPATPHISGMLTSTSMTATFRLGTQGISLQAIPEVETIGNPTKTGPKTTAGHAFLATVMTGAGSPAMGSSAMMTGMGAPFAGLATIVETSIMSEYSLAATVSAGPHTGAAINGSVFALEDSIGQLHGYFARDSDGAIFPLIAGSLGSKQMLIDVNLMGAGQTKAAGSGMGGSQLMGIAMATPSIIQHQIVYKGTFTGPADADSGTWLISPPEQ